MHCWQKLLDNVLAIDIAMHTLAIYSDFKRAEDALALFFDILAAFPSLAHKFLWLTLVSAGLPPEFIRALRKVYVNNKHLIKIDGKIYDGPTILAGVRQGCVLSMLLFAICIEALLRLIEKLLEENDEAGCFADDLAIVIHSAKNKLAPLALLFEKFAKASCLTLNISKCVCVPLGSDDDIIESTKPWFYLAAPAWSKFKFDTCAEYLGFMLGPGAVGIQWN